MNILAAFLQEKILSHRPLNYHLHIGVHKWCLIYCYLLRTCKKMDAKYLNHCWQTVQRKKTTTNNAKMLVHNNGKWRQLLVASSQVDGRTVAIWKVLQILYNACIFLYFHCFYCAKLFIIKKILYINKRMQTCICRALARSPVWGNKAGNGNKMTLCAGIYVCHVSGASRVVHDIHIYPYICLCKY